LEKGKLTRTPPRRLPGPETEDAGTQSDRLLLFAAGAAQNGLEFFVRVAHDDPNLFAEMTGDEQ